MSNNYFLTTERIGFREWNLGDIEHAMTIWQDEEVTKYTGGPLSVTKIHNRLITENRLLRLYNVQYWPIFLKSTGEFIGCCGLRPYSTGEKIFEIGFYIKRSLWNKGLATEAVHAMIDYAFNSIGAAGLFSGHHPENLISKRILEHSGFTYAHDEFYEPTQLEHPSYMLLQKDYCTFCTR
ncbi:MAG: N-acetyltransferase [Flavipsychrobacter sp.]|jgi:RimJ/RimL family protein N-acetyltransferase|nr:N-acetyltransferase [Flavipsychrobacter sp.]